MDNSAPGETMTAFDEFVSETASQNPDFLGKGLLLPETPLNAKDIWLNRNINASLARQLLQKFDINHIKEYIKHHSAEILAINIRFFKVMDEAQKQRLQKKVAALLLANQALKIRNLETFDSDLDTRCKAILTLLDDPDNFAAKQVFMPKPVLNSLDETLQHLEKTAEVLGKIYEDLLKFNLELCIKGLIDQPWQIVYFFYEKTVRTLHIMKDCIQYLEDALQRIKDCAQEFYNDPWPKLYAINLELQKFIAFIHNERVNWAFDDTTPLVAAQGIIDATHYNPLGYSTGLAKKNLDSIGLVTGQLSWVIPTMSVLLHMFQLGLEAKYSDDSSQFWENLPLEEKQRLMEKLLWALVNGVSFWLSFGLGGNTVIRDKLTVDGAGLLLNIAGMLVQMGMQIHQLTQMQLKIDQKISDKTRIDNKIQQLMEDLGKAASQEEKARLKGEIRVQQQEQKALRMDICQLQLQRNTLTAEIFLVSLGILGGMVLMALEPFAPILPAIGAIVNSVAVLLFTMVQHTLKIRDTAAWEKVLAKDLEEKLALFTGEDSDEQRLLFFEILTLENEIAVQDELYYTQLKLFAVTILVKLAMQTVIFFAISLAPISLAFLSVGLGVVETKLLEYFGNLTWNPKTLPDIPEVHGGYVLCNTRDEVSDKALFIEFIDQSELQESDILKVYYQDARNNRQYFEIPVDLNPELKDINSENIRTYFTEILKVTSEFITPGAHDFERLFRERKQAVNPLIDAPKRPKADLPKQKEKEDDDSEAVNPARTMH